MLKKPGVIAYLLQKPKEEIKSIEDIIQTGIERIEEAVNLPIVNEKGKIDDKQFARVVKILALLQKREETIHLKFPERLESHLIAQKKEKEIRNVKQSEEEYLNNLDISKLETIPTKPSDPEEEEDIL